MNLKDFKHLHKLLHSQPRIPAWKELQTKVLEKQLKIDFQKAREGDPDHYYPLRILQRLVDSMFWMHVNHELTDVRRVFYSGTKIQSPKESNLKLHVEKIRTWHETTEHFALYADLASNIAVGDVVYLMKDDKMFMPVELKEGEINKQALEAIKQRKEGNDLLYQQLSIDKKKKKQIERIERQIYRIEHQVEIYLNNEAKVEPSTAHPKGGKIKIIPQPTLSYFDTKIKELLEAKKKDWDHVLVDDCLDIVVLRSETGLEKFSKWMDGNKTKRILANFKDHNLEETFSRPLFTFNFSPEHIWEILTGDTIVLMMFSMDRYLECFSGNGVEYRKVEGKKFRQLSQLPLGQRPHLFFDQYVVETLKEGLAEFYWTNAMFYRLFGCLQTPGSLHLLHRDAHKETMNLIKEFEESD